MNTNNETFTDNAGIIRWMSNNRCVPMDCLDNVVPANYDRKIHKAAVDADNAALIAEYCQNVRYTPEQKYEIMCELGPDAVNVITGKRVADY
jgi:hypothetical protein